MSSADDALIEHAARQNRLLEDILQVLKVQGQAIAKIQEESVTTRRLVDGLKTMASQPLLDEVRRAFHGKQLSFMDTLHAISAESLSFARFGDGELRNMFRPEYSIYFQRNSAELSSDLKAAFAGEGASNLLIGLPQIFADHLHWNVVLHELWSDMKAYVGELPRFGNLHVTRPVAFQAHGDDLVDAWRHIWDDREVLIVTGKGSRFELEPDLFDNLRAWRFEHSLPRDAYSDLNRVEQAAVDAPEKMVLISLGPAGSVLAHRLAKAGKQALDLGHLSSSYANVMKGGAFPERTAVAR
ncbi:GT-D fold domain-containing glycosyltransferase [Arthrobacter sp. YD2]|uniref:GT-D fold domain-containing glycosyltransferase n=1 Tax=Arthrobacter sp. YD2 TaxID=3058046 RepID=UPI0025B5A277|nr:GT-D fold domain-containing glycosyltransferase [Arthrobacter sp. YD2]MDN3904218.1 GT-D fold domain-containing glycosyltransferase [Arthrobacter sp. YD2]